MCVVRGNGGGWWEEGHCSGGGDEMIERRDPALTWCVDWVVNLVKTDVLSETQLYPRQGMSPKWFGKLGVES